MAGEITSLESLDSAVLTESTLGVTITLDEIKHKIALLSQTQTEDLRPAMAELKKALKINPDAANLLLPEEIGALVSCLYKITGEKVLEVKAKATVSKAKKVDFNKVDIKALDDF